MFVSKITKCEVKLLYVSEGENQSPNISTQQIMEDMKFDCAQIHLTQRAVTSFSSKCHTSFQLRLVSTFMFIMDWCLHKQKFNMQKQNFCIVGERKK